MQSMMYHTSLRCHTGLPPLAESSQEAADTQSEGKHATKEETEEIFVPNAQQETNAWEVIKNWTDVAEERRNRGPNLSYYSAENDECISTNSLLTYSVTEAPSTGGLSNRYACAMSFVSAYFRVQTLASAGFHVCGAQPTR
jgi:hypothetical protein